MTSKYPTKGKFKEVDATKLEEHCLQGWQLLRVLLRDTLVHIFEQVPNHQPVNPNTYGIPTTILVERSALAQTPVYLMYLEDDSLGSRLEDARAELDAQIKFVEEAAEKITAAEKEREALRVQKDRADSLLATREETILSLRTTTKELADQVKDQVPAREDLRLIIKALGADRVGAILGRTIEDPDPVPDELIPKGLLRLLEDEI